MGLRSRPCAAGQGRSEPCSRARISGRHGRSTGDADSARTNGSAPHWGCRRRVRVRSHRHHNHIGYNASSWRAQAETAFEHHDSWTRAERVSRSAISGLPTPGAGGPERYWPTSLPRARGERRPSRWPMANRDTCRCFAISMTKQQAPAITIALHSALTKKPLDWRNRQAVNRGGLHYHCARDGGAMPPRVRRCRECRLSRADLYWRPCNAIQPHTASDSGSGRIACAVLNSAVRTRPNISPPRRDVLLLGSDWALRHEELQERTEIAKLVDRTSFASPIERWSQWSDHPATCSRCWGRTIGRFAGAFATSRV